MARLSLYNYSTFEENYALLKLYYKDPVSLEQAICEHYTNKTMGHGYDSWRKVIMDLKKSIIENSDLYDQNFKDWIFRDGEYSI